MSEKSSELEGLNETPNFEYLNALEDEELKETMISLVKNEIADYCNGIESLLEKTDSYSIFMIIHKLSTKYSILGMKDTYKYVKKMEDDLKSNKIIHQDHLALKALSEKLLDKLNKIKATG